MIIINIAALVVAVAVVALVVALIPLVRELKATAVALRVLTVKIDTDIQPIIKDLQVVLADMSVITTGAAGKIDDVKNFMAVIGETGRGLRTINSIVGGVAETLSKSSLWITGAKVAGSFMLERLTKKRR